MIYKIYPSINDFENLSRLKVESSDFANDFDYSNVVVNKPWGYEYLWFQNQYIAIWFLRIAPGQSTSLHCHAKKRTSLIVLDGSIICTTIDDKYCLNKLDSVVLEACVFHSSKAISESGAFVMEIETPPMKGDLVRMHDVYGRQDIGYEKANVYSEEFTSYEYFPFDHTNSYSWKFKDIEISLIINPKPHFSSPIILVPIKETIHIQHGEIIEIGEAIEAERFNLQYSETTKSEYEFLVFQEKY
ncbi:MAG: cupin domain-containing protein [Sediminibacterium sp.]